LLAQASISARRQIGPLASLASANPLTALLTPRPQVDAPYPDAYQALRGAVGGLLGFALADAGAAPSTRTARERGASGNATS